MGQRSLDTGAIDRAQLRALLKCYFRLAFRGRVTQSMGRRGLPFIVGLYVLMGLMIGVSALFGRVDVFTLALLTHSMTFFVVGMAVTSESGDILFNVNESEVLVHRPIDSRTLMAAKAINVIAFALILAGALNLAPTFFGVAARGARIWFPVIHTLSVVGLCVFCTAAVVCTYGVAIRFFDRNKFDNVATWSQVGMSVVFMGGYQAVPRLMEQFQGQSLASYAQYLWLLPPAWFAGMDSWAAGDHAAPGSSFVLAVIGWTVTGALAYVAVGRLAPSYSEGLINLSESSRRSPRATPAETPGFTTTALNPVLRWWLSDPIERGAFRLAAVYMRRDRDVKLRLYPSLSLFVVFPLLFSLSDRGLSGTSRFIPLMTTWMLGMMPLSALETLRISAHFAAADLFWLAPLQSAAPVFHGVRKAVLLYLWIPATVVAIALVAYLARDRELLLLLIPTVIATPTLSLIPGLRGDYMPLSRPATRGEHFARNMGLMYATMLTSGAIVGLSWVASSIGWLWELVVVESIVVLFLHRTLNRIIRGRRLRGAADAP